MRSANLSKRLDALEAAEKAKPPPLTPEEQLLAEWHVAATALQRYVACRGMYGVTGITGQYSWNALQEGVVRDWGSERHDAEPLAIVAQLDELLAEYGATELRTVPHLAAVLDELDAARTFLIQDGHYTAKT